MVVKKLGTVRKVRISPTKINFYLNKICQKNYTNVLLLLKTFPAKPRIIIWKLLKATHSQLSSFPSENIIVSEAYVTKGPVLKRFQARAKGKAFPIKSRTSNITLVVSTR